MVDVEMTIADELAKMKLEDYIKLKKEIVSKKWSENQGKNRDAHEYYKGQFIVLRELLDPKYRRIFP